MRETEEFFQSLTHCLEGQFEIPSYTQLCFRKCVTDIVLDTTGLKVYGSGEWRGLKYGTKRGWKKLHLAIDLAAQKLILAEVISEYVHDNHYLDKALSKASRKSGKILIDRIADSRR